MKAVSGRQPQLLWLL